MVMKISAGLAAVVWGADGDSDACWATAAPAAKQARKTAKRNRMVTSILRAIIRARIYRTSASNEIVHNEVGLQSVHVSEPAAAPRSNGRNSLQDPAAV